MSEDVKKILITPRMTHDSISMWTAAKVNGWEVERLKGWRTNETDVDAIYGEALWSRVVASQVGRVLVEPRYDWLIRLPGDLTLRDMYFGPIKNLNEAELPAFIKPVDDKLFEAKVYTHRLPVIDPETLVIASSPVEFTLEWRFWILHGKAMTASRYKGEDDLPLNTYHKMRELAEIASTYSCPQAVTIDVGMMKWGRLAVVEANPAWCSGLYTANPAEALKVVEKCCLKSAPAEYIHPVTLEAMLDG